MSKNATKVNTTVTKLANRSILVSEIARAEAEAHRAAQAAAEAIRAAKAAYFEAEAAREAYTAGAATKHANAAHSSARSAGSKARDAKNARVAVAVASRTAMGSDEGGHRSADVDQLAMAVDQSARYLVTHNGRLLASFVNVDDALLFEAELAELDRAHDETSVICEVRDRRGHRMGGYLLAGTTFVNFIRDEQSARRFGRGNRA